MPSADFTIRQAEMITSILAFTIAYLKLVIADATFIMAYVKIDIAQAGMAVAFLEMYIAQTEIEIKACAAFEKVSTFALKHAPFSSRREPFRHEGCPLFHPAGNRSVTKAAVLDFPRDGTVPYRMKKRRISPQNFKLNLSQDETPKHPNTHFPIFNRLNEIPLTDLLASELIP